MCESSCSAQKTSSPQGMLLDNQSRIRVSENLWKRKYNIGAGTIDFHVGGSLWTRTNIQRCRLPFGTGYLETRFFWWRVSGDKILPQTCIRLHCFLPSVIRRGYLWKMESVRVRTDYIGRWRWAARRWRNWLANGGSWKSESTPFENQVKLVGWVTVFIVRCSKKPANISHERWALLVQMN